MRRVQRIDKVVFFRSIWLMLAICILIQAAYALWLHGSDPCVGDVYEAPCTGKLHFFFGNRQADEVAALIVAFLSVGLSLVWFSFAIRYRLPSLLRRGKAFAVGRGVRGLLAEFRGRIAGISHVLFSDYGKGPDAKRIKREFEKSRVRRARAMIHKSCPVFVSFMIFILYQGFFGWLGTMSIWGDYDRRLHWAYVYGTGAVPLLAFVAVAVVGDMYPSIVTPVTLDCVNMWFSSVWAWKMCVSYTEVYLFHQDWLNVTRLMTVFYLGNARLSISTNAILFAINVANVLVRPGLPGVHSNLWVIYRDLCVFMGISAMTWSLERFQLSEARTLVRVQKSDRTAALVEQVLSRVCDAVPMLDADLCLSEPCADLGALLLRERRIPTGSQFLDLIFPEDRGLFRQSLAGPAPALVPGPSQGGAARKQEADAEEGAAGAAAFAGLCHLRMLVANSEQVKVSVFYSCVPDPDGLPTYLLGIREDREEGGPSVLALVEPPGSMLGRTPALAALPEAQPSVVSDDRSSSAWSSVSGGSDNEGAEEGAVTAWIDANSDDMKVMTSSLNFVLLGGAGGVCKDLYQWMSEQHVSDIATIVDIRNRKKSVKVVLHPPGQGKSVCRVALGPADAVFPELADEDTDPVLLVFKIKKTHVQTAQPEWDTTKELMAHARKKGQGGPVQQAAGAANSVRQGLGQLLPALPEAGNRNGPRSAASSALPHAIPDSSAGSEPLSEAKSVAQL